MLSASALMNLRLIHFLMSSVRLFPNALAYPTSNNIPSLFSSLSMNAMIPSDFFTSSNACVMTCPIGMLISHRFCASRLNMNVVSHVLSIISETIPKFFLRISLSVFRNLYAM